MTVPTKTYSQSGGMNSVRRSVEDTTQLTMTSTERGVTYIYILLHLVLLNMENNRSVIM